MPVLARARRWLIDYLCTMPRVSVAVSTYCGADLVSDCIRGIEAQTIASELEIIVVDSGSPQNEREIVQGLQRIYSNVLYVRTERETLYSAWNRALALASGRYFANVNVDDWMRDDTLELFSEALDFHEHADLAYSHWTMTSSPRAAPQDDMGWPAMHPAYIPALPLFYCYSGCVQFWRRSTLVKLGGYDRNLSACGDLDMLRRLTYSGGTAVLVPEMLQGFYFNPNGISQTSEQSTAEQLALFRQARTTTPIERLYVIEPDNAESEASAWTDLGNLAYQIRVPWHNGPFRDVTFALDCYERALALAPSYQPALHNRFAVLFESGRCREAEATLDSLTSEHAAAVRGGDLRLVDPGAVPSLRGAIFRTSKSTTRSSGTS
jgi:hypothetical protein